MKLTYRHAVVTVFLGLMALPAACKKRPPDGPSDPIVTYGQFCSRTGTAFCTCVGVAVPQCAELYNVPCLGGRDSNSMSDRTDSQTAACERALSSQCTMIVGGQLPPECPQLASLALPFPAHQ